MKHSTPFSIFLSLLLATSAFGQESQESAILQKIRRTFAQADRNGDGALDAAEAKRATIPSADFLGQDHDGNRKLSEAEFLMYYRQLLVNAKRTIDTDVQREVTRIEAERKARAERAKQRREAERARREAAAEQSAAVKRKLKRAEDALAKEVGEGGVPRKDAKQSKDKLVDRARGAGGTRPTPVSLSGTVSEKLKKAEAALERDVANGKLTRAEATQRRDSLRLRAADASGRTLPPEGKQPEKAKDAAEEVDIERRFERAQDALKQASGNGELTREEAKLKKDRLVDRARNAKAQTSPAEREKLKRELAELDAQLGRGELSKQDYQTQRTSLIERARDTGIAGGGARASTETSGGERNGQTEVSSEQKQQQEQRARAAKQQQDRESRDAAARKQKQADDKRRAEREQAQRDKAQRAKAQREKAQREQAQREKTQREKTQREQAEAAERARRDRERAKSGERKQP